jgi:membrane-bound metal-dependent hydrolase YbcI (DUF457 family)
MRHAHAGPGGWLRRPRACYRSGMFVGHFAMGLMAKRVTPQVSLGWLLAAPLLLDLIWPVFLLLGVETVRIDPGNTVVTPLDLHDYPYSHSLLMALVWAAAFGAVLGHFYRKSITVALVGAALVFSHWILDFVTHRPDMPLYPGSQRYVGLGLWNSVIGTLLVELSMFAAGIALYARATRARDRKGSLGFWSLMALLLALYLASIFGPPPPDVPSLIAGSLALVALLGWAFWADRHRQPLAT